jgi:proteasome assembly chaperone (PAC2) family protein
MGILELGQYAAALTAIAVLLGMTIKWAIVKPIKTYIDTATYPIHPDSNAGKSLADVAKTVLRIETSVKDLDYRLNNIEELVTKPATRSKKATI